MLKYAAEREQVDFWEIKRQLFIERLSEKNQMIG